MDTIDSVVSKTWLEDPPLSLSPLVPPAAADRLGDYITFEVLESKTLAGMSSLILSATT